LAWSNARPVWSVTAVAPEDAVTAAPTTPVPLASVTAICTVVCAGAQETPGIAGSPPTSAIVPGAGQGGSGSAASMCLIVFGPTIPSR